MSPGDLFRARVIVTRAVEALGRSLSVGEASDLLADNTEWPLALCHEAAHALMPRERCARAACDLQPSETEPVERAREHAHAARYGSESLGGSDDE